MKPDQANKIISEYVEGVSLIDFNKFHYKQSEDSQFLIPKKLYSKSLDALAPVWEKLNDWDLDITIRWCNNEWQCDMNNRHIFTASSTVQEAAAIATAMCIQELNDKE